jgi:hypothetical protein
MTRLVTRGRLSSTSHHTVHAAQKKPTIAHVDVDGHIKAIQMYRLTAANEILP